MKKKAENGRRLNVGVAYQRPQRRGQSLLQRGPETREREEHRRKPPLGLGDGGIAGGAVEEPGLEEGAEGEPAQGTCNTRGY